IVSSKPSWLCGAGILPRAVIPTSNTAALPPESAPSTRKRTVVSPRRISSPFTAADLTTHRLGPVDERGKIGVLEREIAAWNRDDLGGVIAELDPDHEWDLRRSDIPGEREVHRGQDAYLGFAQRWRGALGSTQLEIVEAKELPDGRLFTVLKHLGAGTHSGAEVERTTVQLLSFKGDKLTRTEVYGDLSRGRATAGLGR